ncbi:Immunoglobulin kappa constant [Merluccius polli]|nr:Immunoglobulin kappa constant [Merluccius polli]
MCLDSVFTVFSGPESVIEPLLLKPPVCVSLTLWGAVLPQEQEGLEEEQEMGVVQPRLSLLPPSTVEQEQCSATLLCTASGGFPLGLDAWLEDSLGVLGKDGHYSWSSTLTLPADRWRKAGSVICEARSQWKCRAEAFRRVSGDSVKAVCVSLSTKQLNTALLCLIKDITIQSDDLNSVQGELYSCRAGGTRGGAGGTRGGAGGTRVWRSGGQEVQSWGAERLKALPPLRAEAGRGHREVEMEEEDLREPVGMLMCQESDSSVLSALCQSPLPPQQLQQVPGCNSSVSRSLTEGVGVVQPRLSLLPPSTVEQEQGSATLLCTASGGFPSDWTLGWKVGGSGVSGGCPDSLGVLGKDGRYSWSSTLTLPADRGSGAAHAEPPSSLHSGAGAGQRYTAVYGQRGLPSDWTLGWKVGGSGVSGGVSDSLGVLGKDGRYSWSSTLTLPADRWRKAGSVSCEASKSGQTPVAQTLNPDQC